MFGSLLKLRLGTIAVARAVEIARIVNERRHQCRAVVCKHFASNAQSKVGLI